MYNVSVLGQMPQVEQLDMKITKLMQKGDIPGLSLVLVTKDSTSIHNYGYSNITTKDKVNSNTLFELGNNGMTFTALGILQLVEQQQLNLDDVVSNYISDFQMKFDNKVQEITIRQLLHHTSGISERSYYSLYDYDQNKNFEALVKILNDEPLRYESGSQFEFSKSNYTLLAMLIEEVSGATYNSFIKENVIDKLTLNATKVSSAGDSNELAIGHKISFYQARPYTNQKVEDPYPKVNYYTNAQDMSTWLNLLINSKESDIGSLIKQTYNLDKSVGIQEMYSYGMGWKISLKGDDLIYMNDVSSNFSSSIQFSKDATLGVAVLSNSNSAYTNLIAQQALNFLAKDFSEINTRIDKGDDTLFSFFAIIAFIYNIMVVLFIGWVIFGIVKAKRKIITGSVGVVFKQMAMVFVMMIPFFLGIYFYPGYAGFDTWETLLVWNSVSLEIFVLLTISAFCLSFVAFGMGKLFPTTNKITGKIPQIVLMSIISGLSDVAIISMITSSFDSEIDANFRIFYYLLIVYTYLIGRRVVQFNLIRISFGLIYNLKVNLIQKIFSTSYKNFEGIDKGRVYSVLNEDVNTIGNASSTIASLLISGIAIIGSFAYLGTISIKITLILIGVMLLLTLIYNFVIRSTEVLYEASRDEGNTFMRLIDGMLNGFKELSLHNKSKISYKDDLERSAFSHKDKIIKADTKFLNADLLGESMLLVLLGVITIGLPIFNPDIDFYMLASFVIVLLYVIAPIEAFLSAAPQLMRIKVAYGRIKEFIKDIPKGNVLEVPVETKLKDFKTLQLNNIYFNYNDQESFGIGPVNFEVKSEEIIFIIGANGSGKSTLAKILLGLYSPIDGKILVNGVEISNVELSEYFSAIFNPAYLFEKLYNVKEEDYETQTVLKLLKTLKLDDKVAITDNRFDTIDLSSGQRKRLALLQCYLENYPIFLFDEWAADQDPYYRNFFYKILLPEMKKSGKTVIAITHDDQYFDVADRVFEMRDGILNEFDITSSISKFSY